MLLCLSPTYEKLEEVYKLQGTIFEVYKEVGTGFLEAVYQESLKEELSLRDIPLEAQKEMITHYKGKPLKQTYKPDLTCYKKK
jgi:GxxExxY protein